MPRERLGRKRRRSVWRVYILSLSLQRDGRPVGVLTSFAWRAKVDYVAGVEMDLPRILRTGRINDRHRLRIADIEALLTRTQPAIDPCCGVDVVRLLADPIDRLSSVMPKPK